MSNDRFYKTLAMNMNNDHKSVYAAAAEVIGMTLTLLTDKETSASDVELREQYVDDIVKQLIDKKPDRLITCLHCIQLHFPAIADRYAPVTRYTHTHHMSSLHTGTHSSPVFITDRYTLVTCLYCRQVRTHHLSLLQTGMHQSPRYALITCLHYRQVCTRHLSLLQTGTHSSPVFITDRYALVICLYYGQVRTRHLSLLQTGMHSSPVFITDRYALVMCLHYR